MLRREYTKARGIAALDRRYVPLDARVYVRAIMQRYSQCLVLVLSCPVFDHGEYPRYPCRLRTMNGS